MGATLRDAALDARAYRESMEEILEYSRGGTPELQTDEVAARELLEFVIPPLLDELASMRGRGKVTLSPHPTDPGVLSIVATNGKIPIEEIL